MDNRLTILIIEDNPDDLFLLQQYVKKCGIETKEFLNAETVAQARSLVNSNPDIIFLDLFLPRSTGIETFYAIREIFPCLPIVILSGMEDANTALQAIREGAQEYLIKGEFNDKILYKTTWYSIERKKIQEKLRIINERYELLAKATSEAVWDMEIKNDTINFWNNGMSLLFGYTGNLNTSRQWWHEKIHEEDRSRIKSQMNLFLMEKSDHFSMEYRFRCANGTYKYVLSRGYILFTNGEPYRIIGSMQDIDELKTAQETLMHEQIRHQQLLTEKTIETQEKERTKLGRDLHDNINQILATCRLCIDAAMKDDSIREEMLPLGFKNLGLAIDEIRKMSRALIPPSLDDIGLDDAVEEMVRPIVVSHAIKISHKIENIHSAPHIQLMIYRVIQEQLHNILKYANASSVDIDVKEIKGSLTLQIADNGIGFDTGKKTMGAGLKNIRSRAEAYGGMVKIISSPHNGCILHMSIPMKQTKIA